MPEFAGFAIFLIIAGFFVLSFFLAVASVIPLIRNVALLIGKKVSFALDFVVWIGFVLSWTAAITDLSVDQWWAEMLLWGGSGADRIHAGEDGFEGGASRSTDTERIARIADMGKCPHCGSRNIRRRYREHRRYKWRCRRCNRVFRSPKRSILLWLGVAAIVAIGAAGFFAVQQGVIALPAAPEQLDESVDRVIKAIVSTMTPVATSERITEIVAEKAGTSTPESTLIPTKSRSIFSTGGMSRADRESQPQIDIEELEELAHNLINTERTKRGMHALEHDKDLGAIARSHSLDMAQYDYFSHDNLRGEDPTDRGNSAGYDCIKNYGSHYSLGLAENIFQGELWSSVTYINGVEFYDWLTLEEIAAEAIEGWMSSPGHRENILDASYDGAGIGVAIAEDGKVYFTQKFC